MTQGEAEIKKADRSIAELSVLVAELTIHTKTLKTEISRLVETMHEDGEQRNPT